MENVDILIIGSGVIGLAIASMLGQKFPNYNIAAVEKHDKLGQETSSRNSEVIHSGIYYPPDSLKAKLCVEGSRLLYEFCNKQDVIFNKIGKLIVANSEEEVKILESLFLNAEKIDIKDLELLDTKQVKRIEPYIKAKAAIFSPSTGIIDSHGLMAKLELIAKQNGVMFAYNHEVVGLEQKESSYLITYKNPQNEFEEIKSRWVINSAGLNSDKIASLIGIDINKCGYKIYPCKGEYFNVAESKAKLVTHLVYPTPDKNLKSVGLHISKGLDGRMRIGPSAFYVNDLNYSVDIKNAEYFYNTVRKYFPPLELSDITPEMAGIRPKLQDENMPFRDFVICHEDGKGLSGLINLIGIESPGLTCCLGIAKFVSKLISAY